MFLSQILVTLFQSQNLSLKILITNSQLHKFSHTILVTKLQSQNFSQKIVITNFYHNILVTKFQSQNLNHKFLVTKCHYCHYCLISRQEGRFFITFRYSKGHFFTKMTNRRTDRPTDEDTTRLLELVRAANKITVQIVGPLVFL